MKLERRSNDAIPAVDYSLYFVTDRERMAAGSIDECVEQAVAGGCTVVQLREKTASSLEFYMTAMRVRRITERAKIPLIINDRADVALAVRADGLHIGQDDLPCDAARRVMGRQMIIGVSVSNLEEAVTAVDMGADYIGVGAMFPTATKPDAGFTGIDELRRIRARVNIPIVVIGGISKETIPLFRNTGIDGIAVASAIASRADAAAAARELKLLLDFLH